jgi:hypothetical protein
VSSPILPTPGPGGGAHPFGVGSTRRASAPFSLPPIAARDTAPQPLPSIPPPEVLDAMADAATAHERLRAQGRELHFEHDGRSGRLHIEVRDGDGRVLRTISPAEALDVAAGKPLE